MKIILVYGDSNTWGQMAYGNRYPYEQRWTNILQQKLGDDYDVVQSGICGRTAGTYDVSEKRHRGDDAFEYAYLTSYPYQCIVIALGTNDLKAQFEASAGQIFENLAWYTTVIDKLEQSDEKKFGKKSNPSILYVLPPNFDTAKSPDRDEEKRRALISLFKDSSFDFVEANELEMSEDGIHFAASAHNKLAEIVHNKLKEVV
jgi:lysophospholipase L1-like esterase